jgi:hypothetical protein
MLSAARLVLQTAALAALLLVDTALHRAWSADAQTVEYQIKATFLCKFGNFVEWPAAPAADGATPFGIGVVGPDAVIDEMVSAARGQTVHGRPIVVRRLRRGEPLDGLGIVFVTRSQGARLAETLAEARGQPILTVTESEQGTAVGSMVNFVVVNDKVKFDIALPPAELSRLKISSRLLAVARQVLGRPS